MSRVILGGCLWALLGVSAAGQPGEPPKFLDKTSLQWMEILQTHKEVKWRKAAVIVLEGKFGPGERGVVGALARAMREDESEDVRLAAAQSLGALGVDSKGEVLALRETLLKDKAAAVRAAAAAALGKMPEHAEPAVPALGEALQDPEPGPRAAAAKTLQEIGEKSRLVMGQLLASAADAKNDRFTRMYLAQLLGTFTDAADKVVPVLTGVVTENGADPDLRQVAVDALANFGGEAAGAAGPLLHTFGDESAPPLLRRSAAIALAKVGAEGKAVWAVAKEQLGDQDGSIRSEAIRLAARLCRDEPELVPALTERALKETSQDARLAAIQELGELGAAAGPAAKALEQIAATAPRASIREAAAAALKKIRGEE